MNLTVEQGEIFEKRLVEYGYRKYKQDYKHSDYVYWKSFAKEEDDDGDRSKGYSVGFAFYDYSKHPQYTFEKSFGVSLEFMLGNNLGVDRLDITITDDGMTLEEFEFFCEQFYNFYTIFKER